MRGLIRPSLSPEATSKLKKRQDELDAALRSSAGKSETEKAISETWKKARQAAPLLTPDDPTSTGAEVIPQLLEMNRRSPFCMYCCDEKAREIDHAQPKSGYPDLVFSWANMYYACSTCNQHKSNKSTAGILFPESPAIRAHLRLSLITGRFSAPPQDLVGENTLRFFELNDHNRPAGRKLALSALESMIKDYVGLKGKGRHDEAARKLDDIHLHPHQLVYEELYLLHLEQALTRDELTRAFHSHPELRPPLLTDLVLRHIYPHVSLP